MLSAGVRDGSVKGSHRSLTRRRFLEERLAESGYRLAVGRECSGDSGSLEHGEELLDEMAELERLLLREEALVRGDRESGDSGGEVG